ncbi:hypothetical protein WPS_30490 [Vulcanimicrobium alpinum]|uniref:Uncharacterized protein n=1 Tax=Vulcanimicrobium alpinum TaxID=3016050 RepID=A0AAN1XYL9_UNVUL|nr:hypothetical protein [Vulcanimicrobium alpinum]BDE07773.1 hypothetical protein WPS_30490 [Vulcanimicrobium alpinum]
MSADDHLSLATLLDEVRPLIVAARDRGEHPRYLLPEQVAFDAVAAVKDRDRERGMPMLVLGLEVVRAADQIAERRVF